MSTIPRSDRATGRLLAFLLVLLAPPCAEYIIGYDDNTGNPEELLFGLLIFMPLYGAPALLIRETARRFGLGWSGILALGVALGIVQAGVIDQSLFSESYRDIDYWDAMIRPTWIEPLGISANAAMNFILGHAVWSYGIPIALAEAVSPPLSGKPWLRLPGLVLTALLYLGAAAVVLFFHLETEADHASTAQVAGSLVVAFLLAIVAFKAGRRRPDRDFPVPGPVAVVALGLVAGLAYNFTGESRAGTFGGFVVATAASVAVARLSRSSRWDGRHVAALATGALLSRAFAAFFVEPIGDVPAFAKYAHNVGFLLGAALLGAWALSRQRSGARVSSE
jgi:hypothetical protein